MHEDLSRTTDEPVAGERAFGITFGVVFLLIGFYRWHLTGRWEWSWIAIAGSFTLMAYFWAAPLRPLNALWHRLGLLLGRIVNPVVMGAVFFLAVSPVGLIMRLSGKDPLRLKLDRSADSYWQPRERSSTVPQSMSNQF